MLFVFLLLFSEKQYSYEFTSKMQDKAPKLSSIMLWEQFNHDGNSFVLT